MCSKVSERNSRNVDSVEVVVAVHLLEIWPDRPHHTQEREAMDGAPRKCKLVRCKGSRQDSKPSRIRKSRYDMRDAERRGFFKNKKRRIKKQKNDPFLVLKTGPILLRNIHLDQFLTLAWTSFNTRFFVFFVFFCFFVLGGGGGLKPLFL